jgi:hypothetical protein
MEVMLLKEMAQMKMKSKLYSKKLDLMALTKLAVLFLLTLELTHLLKLRIQRNLLFLTLQSK